MRRLVPLVEMTPQPLLYQSELSQQRGGEEIETTRCAPVRKTLCLGVSRSCPLRVVRAGFEPATYKTNAVCDAWSFSGKCRHITIYRSIQLNYRTVFRQSCAAVRPHLFRTVRKGMDTLTQIVGQSPDISCNVYVFCRAENRIGHPSTVRLSPVLECPNKYDWPVSGVAHRTIRSEMFVGVASVDVDCHAVNLLLNALQVLMPEVFQ